MMHMPSSHISRAASIRSPGVCSSAISLILAPRAALSTSRRRAGAGPPRGVARAHHLPLGGRVGAEQIEIGVARAELAERGSGGAAAGAVELRQALEGGQARRDA